MRRLANLSTSAGGCEGEEKQQKLQIKLVGTMVGHVGSSEEQRALNKQDLGRMGQVSEHIGRCQNTGTESRAPSVALGGGSVQC